MNMNLVIFLATWRLVVGTEKCKMAYSIWGQNEMLRFLGYHHDDASSFYIGGLNALYRLSYQDHKWKTHERISWLGDPTMKRDCVKRGNPPRECENYIRAALLSKQQHIILCGTNGQVPRLYTHNLSNQNVSLETKSSDGKLRCSADPKAVPTKISLIRDDITFLATKSSVFSSRGVSTNVYTYEQLNAGAEVIGLLDHNKHIYIFLNEEDMVGKTAKIARVARVCKDDTGYKGKWMSFVKTTLRCDGDGDFTYIQAVSSLHLGDSLFIFIIFHTKKYPWLYNQKFSALCIYEIRDIERAFLASSLMKRDDSGCWIPLQQTWNVDGSLAANLANCHYDEEKIHYVNAHPILNTTVYGRIVWIQKSNSSLLTQVAAKHDNNEELTVYLLHQDNVILKLHLNTHDWSTIIKRKLMPCINSMISFFDILKGQEDSLIMVSDSRVIIIQCNPHTT